MYEKMLHIFWPRKINNEFFKLTEQEDTGTVLVKQRWRSGWIGHRLRREITTISKVALRWTPERNIREAVQNTPRGGLRGRP